MSFFPYFVCALLGVDFLRGGLAEGNRIYSGGQKMEANFRYTNFLWPQTQAKPPA